MDRLRIKAVECKYREWDRRLKEQFINGINSQTKTVEIIRKLTTIKDTRNIKGIKVLSRVKE